MYISPVFSCLVTYVLGYVLLSTAYNYTYDRLIWLICEVVLMGSTNGLVITKTTSVNSQ